MPLTFGHKTLMLFLTGGDMNEDTKAANNTDTSPWGMVLPPHTNLSLQTNQ